MSKNSNTKKESSLSLFFDQCFEKGLFREFDSEELKRAEKLVDMFDLKKTWHIMEPGCGCGRMTRMLAEKLAPEGRIFAFEISSKMIDYCRKSEFPPFVHFFSESVLHTNLAPDTLDAVICFNVWPHFKHQDKYLVCFKKLLKPGGFLFIAHSCGREFINSIHKNSGDVTIRNHLLPSVEQLSRYLEDHGWVTIEKLEQDDLYFLKSQKKP